jgi:hypothetical protein
VGVRIVPGTELRIMTILLPSQSRGDGPRRRAWWAFLAQTVTMRKAHGKSRNRRTRGRTRSYLVYASHLHPHKAPRPAGQTPRCFPRSGGRWRGCATSAVVSSLRQCASSSAPNFLEDQRKYHNRRSSAQKRLGLPVRQPGAPVGLDFSLHYPRLAISAVRRASQRFRR